VKGENDLCATLQYIVCFPQQDHQFHHKGKVAGLSEKLDERVSEYLRRLVVNGTNRVQELQSRAAEFVEEKVFFGEKKIEMTRRRFCPSRKKVRNIITSVRLKKRFSRFDQENIMQMKEKWSEWADVYFMPR
jgi:serine/threonine-protein kinase RIO1